MRVYTDLKIAARRLEQQKVNHNNSSLITTELQDPVSPFRSRQPLVSPLCVIHTSICCSRNWTEKKSFEFSSWFSGDAGSHSLHLEKEEDAGGGPKRIFQDIGWLDGMVAGWGGGEFAAAEIYTTLQATKRTCLKTSVQHVATSRIFREQCYKEMKGEEVRGCWVRKMGSKGGATSPRDSISAHKITSKQPGHLNAKMLFSHSSLWEMSILSAPCWRSCCFEWN